MEGILSSCEEEERCVIFDILFPISSSTYRIYIFRHASLLGWKKVTSDAIISTQYNKITHCCRRNNNKILWVIHLQANDGRHRRRFFISTSSLLHIALHRIYPEPDHFRINSARVVLYVSAANGIRYIYAGCRRNCSLWLHNDMRAFHNFLCSAQHRNPFSLCADKTSWQLQPHAALEAHFDPFILMCESTIFKKYSKSNFQSRGRVKSAKLLRRNTFSHFRRTQSCSHLALNPFCNSLVLCAIWEHIKNLALCVLFWLPVRCYSRDNKDPCLIAGHDQNFR